VIKFTDEELMAQRLAEAETVSQQAYSIGYEQGWDEGRADQAEAVALLTDTIRASDAEVIELRKALNQTSHYLVLNENGWSIEHLVSCRADGLSNCGVHIMAERRSEMFQTWGYGRYKVSQGEDGELVIEEEDNG